MERRVDKESLIMLNQLGCWMTAWIMEAQKKHFDALGVTIKYKSGWGGRLSQLKRNFSAAVNGPVVFQVIRSSFWQL